MYMLYLFYVVVYYYCETLCNATKCENHASRGDSSFHEIYHSKDADTPIVEIPADFNEDQVSNSIIQIDKPYPIDSEYSRGLPVQRQCANANVMRDDCGTPVPKDDRMEPGPLQINDGSSPGDLPVESPSRVDSNDKGGELETPYASNTYQPLLLQISGFYHDPNDGWYYSTSNGLYYKFENGNYVLLESVEASYNVTTASQSVTLGSMGPLATSSRQLNTVGPTLAMSARCKLRQHINKLKHDVSLGTKDVTLDP
ncbi:hypothetical protein AgCh_028378 [Apium graveolens]